MRKQVKVLKSQYSLEQKVEMSRPLWKELEQTDFFKEARTVLLYWSMDDEVFTHDYVCKWAGEKTVLLPCVKGDVLELRVFKGMESLQPGEAFGILEPVGELSHGLRRDLELDCRAGRGLLIARESSGTRSRVLR